MKEKVLFTCEGIVRIPNKQEASLTEVVCSVLCVALFVIAMGATIVGMFAYILK